jgi:helicase
LVESAFREGKINVIFATPTLMAGVNLPVKTVMFDSCNRDWEGGGYISVAEYTNMAGRAGRKGLHEEGRSVLLARRGAEVERFKRYLEQNTEVITSQLVGRDLEKVILQAIAGGLAGSESEIEDFFGNSLHATLAEKEHLFPKQEVFECLDRLSTNGMVEHSQGNIKATSLGKQVATAGVSCESGKLLYESLGRISTSFEWNRTEVLEKQILFLSTSCPDLAPSTDETGLLFVHYRHDNITEIRNSLKELAGLFRVEIVEDMDRSLLSAIIAHKFINRASFRELAALARYASGANVRRIARNCGWMLTAAAFIEDARGKASNREFRKWLLQMAKRLEYGVSGKAIGLALITRFGDVRGLGRTRLERLADAGFNDLTKLLGANINELAEIVNSTRRAEALRSSVIAFLDDCSKKNKILHENRASECGRSTELISHFYEARGTEFNRAALFLLQTVLPDTREQDLGNGSEPDLAIPLSDGLLVIECKTKQSTEGTIGVNDAFAVVGKAGHLHPVGMVTLGMPRFDEEPIRRAMNVGVCLVTHIVFCEAIIRIWEGRIKVESLISKLKEPGLLDKTDLDQLNTNA